MRYYDKFMETARKFPPLEDEHGTPWVFFSIRYFASVNGLNIVTASRNIAMFALFGLILKASSIAYTNGKDYPQFMRDGYERHEKQDEFGIMWYSIPQYTLKLLTEAERLAAIWQSSGYPRKSISKATLIRLYGFALADRAYGENGVRIAQSRQQIERVIEDAVLDAICRNGFAIAKEIESALNDHGRNIWWSLRRDLCQRYELKYGPPSAEEKRRFNLTSGKWIIRPP